MAGQLPRAPPGRSRDRQTGPRTGNKVMDDFLNRYMIAAAAICLVLPFRWRHRARHSGRPDDAMMRACSCIAV